MGIEPTLEAWEAAVLPLNYTRGLVLNTHYTRWDIGKAANLPTHYNTVHGNRIEWSAQDAG